MTTPEITVIAVDLDGTLLNSAHEITPRTLAALREAIRRGVRVILATGKTFASGEQPIAALGLRTPGVYNQGLTLYNPDGTICHEQTLDTAIARQVVEYAEASGITAIAYQRSRLLSAEHNAHVDFLVAHHEPVPDIVGPLSAVVATTPVNKVILVDDPARVTAARQALTAQLDGSATLVQAIPQVLEILPPGASKGAGVQMLLDDLGLDAANLLAIGDGENDVEMLQLAGIGVAMGNASPPAKAAADVIVAGNDDDGVAEAVERFVLGA